MPIEQRFWPKVDKSGECWVWVGSHVRGGYGNVGYNGKVRMAHRVAWEMENGPIPEGMVVCHRCDNPPCVRVDHLFLGTEVDNAHDKIAKGRANTLRGSAVGTAKLTVEQVEAIRAEWVPYVVSQPELARRYGVSRSAIGRLLTGRTHR